MVYHIKDYFDEFSLYTVANVYLHWLLYTVWQSTFKYWSHKQGKVQQANEHKNSQSWLSKMKSLNNNNITGFHHLLTCMIMFKISYIVPLIINEFLYIATSSISQLEEREDEGCHLQNFHNAAVQVYVYSLCCSYSVQKQ